jgi:hypothetical protein
MPRLTASVVVLIFIAVSTSAWLVQNWRSSSHAQLTSLSSVSAGRQAAAPISRAQLHQCAALRGNGTRVFSTLGSLARLSEVVGPFDAMSGASSGGIATFLYESMRLNPEIEVCGSAPCDRRMLGFRIALSLKSLLAYVEILKDTDEVKAIGNLGGLFMAVKKTGAKELLERGKILEAAHALRALFETKQFSGLINPEAKQLLSIQHIGSLKANVHRLLESVKALADLDAADQQILLRVGLVDMHRVSEFIGRIGSFYAARGPSDRAAWRNFFNECTAEKSGSDWAEISQKRTSTSATTCGEVFKEMATSYRARLVAAEPIADARENDLIGAHYPVFNSSSVLEGKEIVSSFESGLAGFKKLQPFDFKPGFEHLKLGYWGDPKDLQLIAQNPKHYPDEKTARFVSLGQAPWKETIYHSASEPGLNHILKWNDSQLTSGGWMDASSVLILKNLGCEKVVFVTRASGESTFVTGVARLLGMNDADNQKLFASQLDSRGQPSSFRLSTTEASGIWCTNWNEKSFPDVLGLFNDGYGAKFITDDHDFRQGADGVELLSPQSLPQPEPKDIFECSFK